MKILNNVEFDLVNGGLGSCECCRSLTIAEWHDRMCPDIYYVSEMTNHVGCMTSCRAKGAKSYCLHDGTEVCEGNL